VNGNYVNQPFQGNIIPPSRFDPVSAKIAANFPAPNLPGLYNNFYWVDRQTQPGKWYNTKIDYDITSSQRLTGNLEIVPAGLGYPAPDPLIDNDAWDIHEYQSEITDVWTISSRLVAEFRVSLAREHGVYTTVAYGKNWPAQLGLANPVANMFPSTTIKGSLSTSIGTSGAGLDTEMGYGPSADFTWVKGKHIIKWAASIPRIGLTRIAVRKAGLTSMAFSRGIPRLPAARARNSRISSWACRTLGESTTVPPPANECGPCSRLSRMNIKSVPI
jgi:hypothetical protein